MTMKINKSMLEKKVLMKDTNILTFKMQLFRIKMFVETSYHVSRNSLVMEVKKNLFTRVSTVELLSGSKKNFTSRKVSRTMTHIYKKAIKSSMTSRIRPNLYHFFCIKRQNYNSKVIKISLLVS